MAATRSTHRINSTTRTRLPLTPKGKPSHRGEHSVAPRVEREPAVSVTPAMHVTPNVVIAVRGDVRSDRRERGERRTPRMSALDLRRFAA